MKINSEGFLILIDIYLENSYSTCKKFFIKIMATTKTKQTNLSTFCMGKFTTSKLIQNLGTRNEVYKFDGYFRSAHGRD